MAEMTAKERVRAALAGTAVDRAPVSLWGHDYEREWTPEALVAATLDAYRPYEWDFIKLNPRATYFAEAWGNEYERPAGQEAPRLTKEAVVRIQDLEQLNRLDPKDGVFGEHLHALRMLVQQVGDELDVLHTVFSPLSVVAQLYGSDLRLQEAAVEDRSPIHAAITVVTETLRGYAQAAIGEGASGIFYAPLRWASRDTCDDDFYLEFGRPYDLEILDAVNSATFNVLHVCGNNNMLADLLEYPVAAFNWADRGQGNPSLSDIKSRTDKAVMGGVDHARLHGMSPEEAEQQARKAASSVREGLFVTAGCAIKPQTPPEVRAAVARGAREA